MGDKKDDDGFDVKFAMLPPDLQVKLWLLALDANTSRVNLAYKPGAFTSSLSYNYGGSLEAGFGYRRFTSKLGVNPSNGNLDLGWVYRGFNFSASTNVTHPTVGFGLTYGASLLPFPTELTTTFAHAAGGLQNLTGDLPNAPGNPLMWYKLHSDDVSAISGAVSAGQQIAKSGEQKDRFGFGLRILYTRDTGLTIYGGAQLRF